MITTSARTLLYLRKFFKVYEFWDHHFRVSGHLYALEYFHPSTSTPFLSYFLMIVSFIWDLKMPITTVENFHAPVDYATSIGLSVFYPSLDMARTY